MTTTTTVTLHEDLHPKIVEAVVALGEQGDLEKALELIAEFLKIDAERNEHPAVKALLESASESCRSAAFEFYASFK